MDSFEPKKLALLRILQILQKHSDYDYPMTQDDIALHLQNDYGIVIERKAIGRNISLLKEAGIEIESRRAGCYLASREFDDSELKLLIDGVLCSRHITPRQSSDLIEKLCKLSNKFFRSRVKNIYTVKEWNKTENSALFYNIEMVDIAIDERKQLQYDYNKYGLDKKLHKSSFQRVTPYQLILHNQRYYLMGYSTYWGNMVFHRLDRISNIRLYDRPAKPIREIPGYESGINYKKLASTMPYMYTDEPERIEFVTVPSIVDQVIDWFGKDIAVRGADDPDKVIISLWASPNAMEHWALQYLNHIEVIAPAHLRDRIRESLQNGVEKYK
jgi:predicted DNA-binding transcriptional regulator YafY